MRKQGGFPFNTMEARKYVKGLAFILLLTVSQISLCLIAAGIGNYFSGSAAAEHEEQVRFTRELRVFWGNTGSPPRDGLAHAEPVALAYDLAESIGADRSG